MNNVLKMMVFGLLLIGLAGCDAVEQSAQKLVEKAEQAVVNVAREAVDETVKEFNKQVDELQQSTNEWLGNPVEEAEQQQPKQPDGQAAVKSIET